MSVLVHRIRSHLIKTDEWISGAQVTAEWHRFGCGCRLFCINLTSSFAHRSVRMVSQVCSSLRYVRLCTSMIRTICKLFCVYFRLAVVEKRLMQYQLKRTSLTKVIELRSIERSVVHCSVGGGEASIWRMENMPSHELLLTASTFHYSNLFRHLITNFTRRSMTMVCSWFMLRRN